MDETKLKNRIVIANIIAMTHAVLLSGDGAGYSVPESFKNTPSRLINDIGLQVREHLQNHIDGGRKA